MYRQERMLERNESMEPTFNIFPTVQQYVFYQDMRQIIHSLAL